MLSRIRNIILLSSLFLLFSSCSKEENDELPLNFEGYNYLPLSIGMEWNYRIDSITYDDFTGLVDTTVYFERYFVEAEQSDLGGRKSYQLVVSRRANDSSAWRDIRKENWHRGVYRFERTINSITYVPLVFPPLEDSRWNVNSLNTGAEQTYRYSVLHESFSLNDSSYDSTLTVLQKDQLSLIGRDFAREVYAAGIGLVYQETIQVETDINSGQINSGFERRRYLID